MKIFLKIIVILVFFLVPAHRLSAQSAVTKADSLRMTDKNTEDLNGTMERNRAQNRMGAGNMQKAGQGNGNQSVKRIRGARPDMSRARGARPPSVVRPSGSGIPKGVGRPGGAGRKGGR